MINNISLYEEIYLKKKKFSIKSILSKQKSHLANNFNNYKKNVLTVFEDNESLSTAVLSERNEKERYVIHLCVKNPHFHRSICE
jgi:hypothetical protein